MHRGIPTTYNGVRFRSRLEARWAAFFDLLDWPWLYEPIDLAGYIPDFILPLKSGRVLVEVKPAFTIHEMFEHTGKIDASGWDGLSLIVGACLPELCEFTKWDHPCLGASRPPDDREWGEAAFSGCSNTHGIGFFDTSHHGCRVCWLEGCADMLDYQSLYAKWAEAGNVTQWRRS